VRVVRFGASSSPLSRLAAGAILLVVGVLALVLLLPLVLLGLAIFLVAWGLGAAARVLGGRGAGVRVGSASPRGAPDDFGPSARDPRADVAGDPLNDAGDSTTPGRRRVRNEALDRAGD
jgi:hypothetical protein